MIVGLLLIAIGIGMATYRSTTTTIVSEWRAGTGQVTTLDVLLMPS